MADLAAVVTERDAWLRVLGSGDDDAVEAEAAHRLRACRAALEEVDQRLAAIGYPVRPIVRDATFDVADLARRLAAEDVTLPAPLGLLWQVVGEVSVLDLSGYAHARFWHDRGVRGPECGDGLHVDAPGRHDVEAYVGYVAGEREAWVESGDEAEGQPFAFPLAPDCLHKDDISGGDPYGLVPGTGPWDGRLSAFDWASAPVTAPAGAPDLLSYLRTAILECACFPGFLGAPTFDEHRRHLTEGLPPF